MRYKYYLFMRGAKPFYPYEKRLVHTHHHSRHHHGGALVTDHELMSILSLLHHKKPHTAHRRRKTGGTVRTRPFKPLVFTRQIFF